MEKSLRHSDKEPPTEPGERHWLSIYLKAHMVIAVSVRKGFTGAGQADRPGGGGAAGLCQGDYVTVSFLAPSCRTLLIYSSDFFIELVLLLPRPRDQKTKFPQRSLTINSEVADARRLPGTRCEGDADGAHITPPWHVLSASDMCRQTRPPLAASPHQHQRHLR